MSKNWVPDSTRNHVSTQPSYQNDHKRQLEFLGSERKHVLWSATWPLTRAALGSPAERAALAGGGVNSPPANSQTSSRSRVGEAAIESSQRLLLKVILNIFLKRSQVRSRSDQSSKPSVFALSAP